MSLELHDGRLTAAQVDQYWQDGFLFPLPAMPPDAARAARTDLEQLERDWLTADLPAPLNTYKRVNAHIVTTLAARIALTPSVLDVVEGLLGPDILIYSTEFFIKEPNTRHMVSMHQDLTYWGLGAIDGLLTAWIALSPATPASGCMSFVKGSHKNEILPHRDTFGQDNLLSRGQEVEVDVAPEDATPIEIHPGQMSLHHGLTIHGSGPNTTTDRRIACVVRYARPDIAQRVGSRDYAMLARGADSYGHFSLIEPPRCDFDAQALSLYEEVRAAQAEVMMKGARGKTEMYT